MGAGVEELFCVTCRSEAEPPVKGLPVDGSLVLSEERACWQEMCQPLVFFKVRGCVVNCLFRLRREVWRGGRKSLCLNFCEIDTCRLDNFSSVAVVITACEQSLLKDPISSSKTVCPTIHTFKFKCHTNSCTESDCYSSDLVVGAG